VKRLKCGVPKALTVLVALGVIVSTNALAQGSVPSARIGVDREHEREPLPEYAPDEAPPRSSFELPPLEALPRPATMDLSRGFVARGFRIVGSTVFSDAELAAEVAPFLDQEIRGETLPAITDALTRLYVEAGYVSSGAIVPDQTIEEGVLEVRIVEGRVEDVEIVPSGRLEPRYVKARIRRSLEGPLRLSRLDEGLRLLQLDPRIARVDAVITPSAELGESRVRIAVEEARPWTMEGRFANDVSPSLGGQRAMASLQHRNVSGWGDTLSGTVSGARGLFDVDLSYRIPFTPWLTEFELGGRFAEGEIVEGDFRDENFRNETASYGLSLIQPLWRSVEDDVRLAATLERRTSRLTFSDEDSPFLLEVNGLDGDEIHLLLLRLELEWVHRGLDQVFAARSRATFGLNAWDATTPNDTPIGSSTLPDGQFSSWLLQLQYARRVPTPLGEGEFVVRQDLQLASGSLFSLESFAMGGASTVRGYAEGSVVSDNGWIGSVEIRVPVLPTSLLPHDLRVAPFVDAGYAWDDHEPGRRRFDRFYASIGAGLIYRYGARFELRVDYGRGLVRDFTPEGDPLQDQGIHVEARLFVF